MKRTALTFDDGPGADTAAILDLLAAHDAHATFFVLGSAIAGREELIRRTTTEGHELAVHGWDHAPVDDLPTDVILLRLADTIDVIGRQGETVIRWWRPPWHRVTDEGAMAAERLGLAYCGVTLDTYDVARSTEMIVEAVERGIKDRAIIGLHDGVAANGNQQTPHRRNTVAAVEQILGAYAGQYEFVTVSELLA